MNTLLEDLLKQHTHKSYDLTDGDKLQILASERRSMLNKTATDEFQDARAIDEYLTTILGGRNIPGAPGRTAWQMDEFSYVHIESVAGVDELRRMDAQRPDKTQPLSTGNQAGGGNITVKPYASYLLNSHDHARDAQPEHQDHDSQHKQNGRQQIGAAGPGLPGRKPPGRPKGQPPPATYTSDEEDIIIKGYMAGTRYKDIASALKGRTLRGVYQKIHSMLGEGKLPRKRPPRK